MNKIILIVGLASLLTVVSAAGDQVSKTDTVKNGEAIYNKSCTKCHSTSVHIKADRSVKSLASLKKRVAGCNRNVGANLNDEELASVSEYLNTTYYKFK